MIAEDTPCASNDYPEAQKTASFKVRLQAVFRYGAARKLSVKSRAEQMNAWGFIEAPRGIAARVDLLSAPGRPL
jgi:hypothetical protein